MGETALGGILDNVTRLGVVAVAIVITLYRTPIEKALSKVFHGTSPTGSEVSEGL